MKGRGVWVIDGIEYWWGVESIWGGRRCNREGVYWKYRNRNLGVVIKGVEDVYWVDKVGMVFGYCFWSVDYCICWK